MRAEVLAVEPLDRAPDATVRVPGSKSLTNRSLVCALLAEGTSTIAGALRSDDTEAMADAIRALGAEVHWEGDRIDVVGTGGVLRPGSPSPIRIEVRHAGTAARFLLPVLALGQGTYELDGSEQLRGRPLGPMVDGLRALGAQIDGDRLPLRVHANGSLTGRAELPGHISSQFVSGLLLSQPYGDYEVVLTSALVAAPFVAMTNQTMAAFGANDGRYRATRYAIEPDATSASYFFAAAALWPGGRVRVLGLGDDSSQGDLSFVDVLSRMGAQVDQTADWTEVRGGELSGLGEVSMVDTPDVAQTLAAVAVFADSPTTVSGISFARGHESDRLAAVVTELRRCGLEAEEHPDGFTVHPGQPAPATVETYGDHRMAMSFALLGLKVPGIKIADPACVAKTFPGYFAALDQLR